MSQYYELRSQCSIYNDIVEYTKTADPSKWFTAYSFDILNIPDEILLKDPVMRAIRTKFPVESYYTRPVCLKMRPNLFYKLHEDTVRQAAINMLIDGWNSHTFYGTPVEGSEDLYDINRLVYKPEHYYLLDTKQLHAVLNFESPRIVFSLGFNLPATYTNVRDFLIDADL